MTSGRKLWKLLFISATSVVALTLIVILTACARSSSSGSGSISDIDDDDSFIVAIFYYDYDDVYVSSVRSILSQNLAQAGIAYQEYDAANDQTTQNKQIDKAISSGADVLVVNIVTSGNAEKSDVICQKAYAADIPVIFFNRSVEEEGYEGVILDYYDDVAFVGTDAAEAGHLQGEIIGNYLVEHYDETDLNGDGIISYASFKGEAGNLEAIYRTKYSVEDANEILSAAGYPDLVYFDSTSVDNYQLDLTGSWSTDSVEDYMITDLLHYDEEDDDMIELVICNSDAMAEGAIKALQTYGYNLGTDDCTTIPVFGVDASSIGVKLIEQGMMTGTVKQDANGMADCIILLINNVKEGRDLFYGTEGYATDEENGLTQKLYIPYSIYDPDTDSEAADADSDTASAS